MSAKLDYAIAALGVLEPVVKLVPVAGEYLECIAHLLNLACTHAKEVKENKEDIAALAERATHYVTIISEKAQGMPESDINRRMGAIHDLKHLMEDLLERTIHQSERSAISRIMRKDKDKGDIKILSERLEQVIIDFGIEAQLNMIYSLDDVLGRVVQLQIGQQQAKDAYLKTEHNALLLTLNPVAGARHDHSDAPHGCTEGTRVDIIEQVIKWIMNFNSTYTILWLSGLAGTGKSTIMRTLSDRLAELRVLGGCFFISIQSEDRRNPQNIARTLAYQLARFQPMLCEPICNVLRNNPDVVNQAMSSHIRALLFDPFLQILEQINKPIVILIDAMDECAKEDDVEGGSFLSTLLSVIHQHPAKLKLVVASRPTASIQRIFNEVAIERFQLHTIEKQAVDNDIWLYLNAELEKITRSRGLDPHWYTTEDIIELVNRAKGLFIYAFTVIKWISNTRFPPRNRLHQILGWRQHDTMHSPFQVIDHLYSSMLQNALGPDSDYHNEIVQRIRQLLEVLVVAFAPLSIPELAAILGHEEDVIRLDLEQLSAVVPIPEKGSTGPVTIYHPLFIEYLTDEKRCPPESGFHVSVWEAHGWMGTRCLNMRYQHRRDKDGKIITVYCNHCQPGLNYALDKWQIHLEMSQNSGYFATLALKKVQEGNPQRCDDIDALFDLSFLLSIQSSKTKEVNVLLDKIAVDQQLVKLVGPSHPSRGVALKKLAGGLQSLYERNGDKQRLFEAINLFEEVLKLCPPGHREREHSLNDLGNGLRLLYDHNKDDQILHEALTLHQEALKLRPPGQTFRDHSLNNLAIILRLLYSRNGNERLLHEAISLDREALKLRPLGHPSRDQSLNNLAIGVTSLHGCTGDTQPFYEAISLHREALALRPPGHLFRDQSLSNLADNLRSLYQHNKNDQLLYEAISLDREALGLRPPGHPARGSQLNKLAHDLRLLYSYTGEEQLLQEAINLEKES